MKVLDLVQPDALVFDVGAHRGDKTAAYLARRARRVVCIEPQPPLAAHMHRRFRGEVDGRVVIEQCALGRGRGVATMLLCDQNETVSTLEPRFCTGRFALDHTWSTRIEVRVDTLDHMRELWGDPDFIKIDVEGYERHVLAGMSWAPPALSFEFHAEFWLEAFQCASYLQGMGRYEWNVADFEGQQMLLDWQRDFDPIEREALRICGGDIYARLQS